MVDQKQQQKSELFVVSSDLDFYWFSVCENEQQQLEEEKVVEEGGLQDGGRSEMLTIERLAFLKKKDLCTELRKQECGKPRDIQRPWLCSIVLLYQLNMSCTSYHE